MYRYCGTYSYTEVLVSTTKLILVLRSIYCNSDTEVPVGTTEQIPYTEVLVGTTGIILILLIQEYP